MNRLVGAVLTSVHNLCFEEKYEKYKNSVSENFHFFFVVKFSEYLNRHVFLMGKTNATYEITEKRPKQ